MDLSNEANLKKRFGYFKDTKEFEANSSNLRELANLKLWFRGRDTMANTETLSLLALTQPLLANFQEKNRLLSDYLCPADQRIQNFILRYLASVDGEKPRLPTNVFQLEHHGIARTLSLPHNGNFHQTDILSSYRTAQGVIHNPKSDRRTTQGSFHVAEGGLPIPEDKKAVPLRVFSALLHHSLTPPRAMMELPFDSGHDKSLNTFVSLLLRPIVVPQVPGITDSISLEVRFFAPGSLVSNLDFVESIFGNAGDPYLTENDAALDTGRWTGHTGCVILAPHLVSLKKKDLGLPHISEATDRQVRDGMYWDRGDELYNEGGGFKITARDLSGVMVTIIADNYFGYCKKEVKTQISWSANLLGGSEEEHAGGAVAFPSYNLGDDFSLSSYYRMVDHTFDEVVRNFGSIMDVYPEGYGIDKTHPSIIYLPETVSITLSTQMIRWSHAGQEQVLRLKPGYHYVLPSGYKVSMVRSIHGQGWDLIGTTAEGTFCHKPCTVSGGGKSEISKPITDAIISGPMFVANLDEDFAKLDEILNYDYSTRFIDPNAEKIRGRRILGSERSLGSVIKLLTPSREYTKTYNDWLNSIPRHVKDLVFLVKRLHKPELGDHWKANFSVDIINGKPGNELKFQDKLIYAKYLRIGFTPTGSWRIFTLRSDFSPTVKMQMEDDITASTVVPRDALNDLNPALDGPSIKFSQNCEFRFFQRPDDAIHRGYDKKTELDFSRLGLFTSNYEPQSRDDVARDIQNIQEFEKFTQPIQQMYLEFSKAPESVEYLCSPAFPRIVNGVPTKNPRYLQIRPDVEDSVQTYLASLGTRFYRRIPLDRGVPIPVNAVLAGRRNNPPDKEAGIRPLAVYNPIHYQELPELFMDFICSLTGKSPSTTGAGSEGALTKGPFNALLPIIDLNYSCVSFMVTQLDCFSSAAGYVGPKYRVDHDVSLLIPEVWARMSPAERKASNLIHGGYLEKLEDFEYNGSHVPASRLGYRITHRFVRDYLGRVFSNPGSVFPEDMLKPELQDMESYVDGIHNIVEAQQRVAMNYFKDGSIDLAIPPLKAILHIMAFGNFEGLTANDAQVRGLFNPETVLSQPWYQERLVAKQSQDVITLRNQIQSLESFLKKDSHQVVAEKLGLLQKLESARERLKSLESPDYVVSLRGTLGLDTSLRSPHPIQPV